MMFSFSPKSIFCGSAFEAHREPLLSPVCDSGDESKLRLEKISYDEHSVSTDSTTSSATASSLVNEAASSPTNVQRPTVAFHWLMTGNKHFGQGQLTSAKDAFVRAIETCSISETDGDHLPHGATTTAVAAELENLTVLADAYSNLATVYWKEGNMARAMDILAESLRVHEHYQQRAGLPDIASSSSWPMLMPLDSKNLVDRHGFQIQAMAAVYHQLGLAFAMKNCNKQAYEGTHHAYMLRLWVHGNKPHKEVASSLQALGNLAFKQQRFDDALVYYEQLFDMKCNESGEEVVLSTDVIHSLTRMSATYRYKGDQRSALFGYRVILSMKQELLLSVDDDDTDTKLALRQSIGKTFVTIGDLLCDSDSYRHAKEAYQSAQHFYIAAGLCPSDERRKQANSRLHQLCMPDNLEDLML